MLPTWSNNLSRLLKTIVKSSVPHTVLLLPQPLFLSINDTMCRRAFGLVFCFVKSINLTDLTGRTLIGKMHEALQWSRADEIPGRLGVMENNGKRTFQVGQVESYKAVGLRSSRGASRTRGWNQCVKKMYSCFVFLCSRRALDHIKGGACAPNLARGWISPLETVSFQHTALFPKWLASS